MGSSLVAALGAALPFREYYDPSVYSALFYLVPFLIGIIVAWRCKTNKLENSLLVAIVLSLLPLVLLFGTDDLYAALSLGFYTLLVPLLCYAGGVSYVALSRFRIRWRRETPAPQAGASDKRYLVLSIILIVAFTSINLISYHNSEYLVGADVYFHAAVSKGVFTPHYDIDPYFKGSLIYPYMPFGYALVAMLGEVTGVNLNTLWLVLPAIGIALFLAVLLIFIRQYYGDAVAFFSLLFIAPLNQFLFNDPSMRIFAYVLLVVALYLLTQYLLTKRTMYLLLCMLFSILTLAFHVEIFAHLLIALLFLVVLWRIEITNLSPYEFDHALLSRAILLLALSAISIVVSLMRFKPVGSLLIYNEVFLSLIYPVGIISFFVAIWFLSWLVTTRSHDRAGLVVLAVILLASNSLFYFTKIWSVHHRYFNETAYVGIALFAAAFLVAKLEQLKRPMRLYLVGGIIVLVALSIYPRMVFQDEYSSNVGGFIDSKREVLDYLSGLSTGTDDERVVLVPNEDFLNRYIPFYADLHIVSGANSKSLRVLPLCGDFGVFNQSCSHRRSLNDAFFTQPSPATFEKLRSSYPFDYIVVMTPHPFNDAATTEALPIEHVYQGGGYEVYEVKAR